MPQSCDNSPARGKTIDPSMRRCSSGVRSTLEASCQAARDARVGDAEPFGREDSLSGKPSRQKVS
jgi:hypothetical protein